MHVIASKIGEHIMISVMVRLSGLLNDFNHKPDGQIKLFHCIVSVFL